jgi:type I restriction enzyme S subunit
MAKAKKKESLTPEERLQAALVPESEQPYPVPANWCWMRGRAFLKPMETKRPEGEVFRYIDIDSIDNKRQQVAEPKNLRVKDAPSRASRKLRPGDTVFSMVRPYLMNIAYIDETISNSIASTGFYVCTPTENVNSLYLYYLMTSPYTVDGLNRYMKGDNSPSIRKDDIENYAYPIPPLPEQQRIVDRIESLFAKLDEAKQKAQDALDSFETRKAAILHKAFTGELTAQWRKEHGVGMESWEKLQWGRFIISIEAGKNWSAEGRPPQSNEFGVVKVSAVTWGKFNELESKTCTVAEQWNENVQIHEGDFLFSRANTLQLVGNCVIVKSISRRLMLSDKILRFKFDKSVIPTYVLCFTRSNSYRNQIEQLASGNQDGMRNVSQKNLKLVEFPIPTLEEQAEIVRILDDLLAKEQQAKEAAEGVLEQIDLMKKAILARAFRGELDTNDPREESAVELVKGILFN